MLIIRSRRIAVAGLAGLFGLFGFSYFFTGNPGDLFFFSFFAFFSFIILGKINQELQDERWLENSRKASHLGFGVALSFLFVLGFFFSRFGIPAEFFTAGSALGWMAGWYTYTIAFWLFERP